MQVSENFAQWRS